MADDRARRARAYGGELAELAEGWLRWAQAPDGWLALLHGELLVQV